MGFMLLRNGNTTHFFLLEHIFCIWGLHQNFHYQVKKNQKEIVYTY